MELPTDEQIEELRTQGDQCYDLAAMTTELRDEIRSLRTRVETLQRDLSRAGGCLRWSSGL